MIKKIIRVGNSAGVLLPKEWYGGEVKVELVKKPLNIEADLFKILNSYLSSIIGIYLTGSYARKEQTERSDVDILVITEDLDKKINYGKYNLILISQKNLEDSLKKSILPLLPMILESIPLMNKSLINKYKSTEINKINLNWHFETTKSAIKVNEKAIHLDKISKSSVSDATIYSLILRLREEYIVDCLINKKKYSTKEFLSLIKKITNSTESYDSYLRVKDSKSLKEIISIEQAEKLLDYISKKITAQENEQKKH